MPGASPELLTEHVQGIQTWRNQYSELLRGQSNSKIDWIRDNFSDVENFEGFSNLTELSEVDIARLSDAGIRALEDLVRRFIPIDPTSTMR
ncbi:MAG: hypothetical protein ACFE0Q_09030 [Anaerolineae bacterium]